MTRIEPEGTSPLPRGTDADPDYSQYGVDLTLIRWMLSLTPAERLEVLRDTVDSLLRLRGGPAED